MSDLPHHIRLSLHRIKYLILVIVISFFSTGNLRCDAQQTGRGIERFRPYQRRCFEVAPCVLFANERGSFGCAQCSDLVIRRSVIEFFTREELFAYLTSSEVRIVMIPEFLFFEQSVLSALETAPNIGALVVYSGDSPNNEGSYPLPYPPVSQASEDFVEPNFAHNYYPEIINSSVGSALDINDYSDPTKILEAITAGKTNYTAHNGFGSGLKFRLFNYNIFYVSGATASDIRRAMYQFKNGSRSVSPIFKLESAGRMYACPPASASGSPSPSPILTTPTPSALDSSSEREFFGRQEADSDEEENLSVATSSKCLSERTCLPIGGQSLWSSLGRIKPRIENDGSVVANSTSPKILAVMAPMDSMAFFPDMAYGASAEIASLAGLLAVSEAVGLYWRTMLYSSTDRIRMQPVYFAWNAQSWGWAGSARFLKDLKNFTCANATENAPGCKGPFMPSLKFFDMKDWISKAINIGQLISPNTTGYFNLTRDQTNHMFLHSFDEKMMSSLRNDFLDQHQQQGDSVIKLSVNSSRPFTPLDASQSFKLFYPLYDNSDFEIISITNYDKNFSNRYYHSIFDHRNLTTIGENYRQPLYAAARLISGVVIQNAFGVTKEDAARVDIRKETIDEVIECMTANWTECKLKNYLPEVDVGDPEGRIVLGNYAGSYFPETRLKDTSPTWGAKIALLRNFLAYHNRYNDTRPCAKDEDCEEIKKIINANITKQTDWQTVFCSFKLCVLSDTYTHDAFGTAIEAEEGGNRSTFKYVPDAGDITEPPGGAWTESAWDEELGLCGYVEDSVLYKFIILGAGIGVLIVSVVSLVVLDRRILSKLTEEPIIALTRDLVPP